MGRRRDRLNKRLARAIVTRRENSMTKTKERTRREEQMQAILKQGELPYTPGVMSWLSGQLGKKASRVTSEDVKSLLG
ncbi:MAG: hypothetical protein KAJ46_04470 [Sedimentisphaerales bacterium]|jgi:hypothetical protein|nr:hypothetical protein [Sedimentisphaerales bacterium]